MAAFRDVNSTAPAHGAVAVTTSDAALLPRGITRAIYVGTSGNITVRMADGDDNVLFATVPVGILPIQVDKIYTTGTGASNILALY